MTNIETLARKRNGLRKKVTEWMAAEGAKGTLVYADMAPDWHDYQKADVDLQVALLAVGT